MFAIKTNQKCQTLSLIFHGPSADPVTVTEHSDLGSTIQQQIRPVLCLSRFPRRYHY